MRTSLPGGSVVYASLSKIRYLKGIFEWLGPAGDVGEYSPKYSPKYFPKYSPGTCEVNFP